MFIKIKFLEEIDSYLNNNGKKVYMRIFRYSKKDYVVLKFMIFKLINLIS